MTPRFLKLFDGTYRRLFRVEEDGQYSFWAFAEPVTKLNPKPATFLSKMPADRAELTNEPLAIVARAFRNPLFLLSRPEQENILRFCELHGILASEVLEYVHDKARTT